MLQLYPHVLQVFRQVKAAFFLLTELLLQQRDVQTSASGLLLMQSQQFYLLCVLHKQALFAVLDAGQLGLELEVLPCSTGAQQVR